MAPRFGFGQRVGGRGLGSARGFGRHVGCQRDPVGAHEADADDLGETVGILMQNCQRTLAEARVDWGRKMG